MQQIIWTTDIAEQLCKECGAEIIYCSNYLSPIKSYTPEYALRMPDNSVIYIQSNRRPK